LWENTSTVSYGLVSVFTVPSVIWCSGIKLSCHVCRHGTTVLPLDGFLWNFVLGTFIKICQENWSLCRIWQNRHMKRGYVYNTSVNSSYDKKIYSENQNTNFMSRTFFFGESCSLSDKYGKYSRASQAIDEHCMAQSRFELHAG
jgi:hypothetical protein